MRTAIVYEKNRLMFKEIVEVNVYKDAILPRINISLSFNEKDEEHNIVGVTFSFPYHKESILYNMKEKYNTSDEKIISAIFKEVCRYINWCVTAKEIIDFYKEGNSIQRNCYVHIKGEENEG